ncbi:MAG: hypothetical protein CMB80_19420 [Flammeovirgaceae bacterium]|nr:hypothetical protein [Flammeovirgaceae bacterium]MBE62511.1 hypothetical protein [Flammeovirgaceae bacterium]MBR08475.1 hypothetical protein [Rickettsiales bacterium]|tara:strand:- start:8477 stop:9028 length:552 start_codon:yes stop_codon:yes gene_type:complete
MPKIVAQKLDWIKYGFELFASQGESALIVDKMSQYLKCNRSSFYWHFGSKKKFIDEIINYWIELDTNQIIQLVQEAESPQDKFFILVKQAFKADSNLDFVLYLKRYATHHEEVKMIIESIDQQRIEFVASILTEIGYTKTESSEKAMIFYKYLIGHHEMNRNIKQEQNYVNKIYKELKHFIDL